ncbi:MAG: diguanylate cyclase [Ketobacter sp.]|nr:MAG: diguanylate cyclase [Ketobacter sp.]
MQGALKRLILIHRFLREFNKQRTLCETRTDLFELLCRLAVQQGGYRFAWVGIQHGDRVVPVVQSGGLGNAPQLSCGESKQQSDPVVRAIFSNQAAVLTLSPDQVLPAYWSTLIRQEQLRAVAVIPIRFKQKSVGVLVLCSQWEDDFSDLYSFTLAELEEDVSTALDRLDEYAHRLDMELQLKQLHQAVESSATSVVVTDTQGFIQYANPFFSELTGYDVIDVLGLSYLSFIPNDFNASIVNDMQQSLAEGRQWRGEVRILASDGSSMWVYQQVSPVSDNQGVATRYVCTLVDHTELHEAHATIEMLAYYDELTGLPNRRLFLDRLQQEINGATRDNRHFAVCFLDLDGFKDVNDSLGHEAGDELLRVVARRIREQVRTKDTVARLGGDEFTLIVTDLKHLQDCARVATNIIKALQMPIPVNGKEVVVTTSIGIANFPVDGNNIVDLSRHADMAMYHAKAKGRNNFQFFTAALNREVERRVELEARLHQSFTTGQLELRLQPQMDGMDGSLHAVESVLHWPALTEFGIHQDEVYEHLESAGMLAEVFEWTLMQACQETSRLHQQFGVNFRLGVRLPRLILRNRDQLFSFLERCLAITGLQYDTIQFEVPETALNDEFNSITGTLHELRSRGAAIAIDRFGMGGTSLRLLSRFKVDVLKIDKSLMADLMTDRNDAAVASAIITLAHQLNIKVLATGVETLAHFQYLERYWCDFLQGDYLAPAMSVTQFQRYLARYCEQGFQAG